MNEEKLYSLLELEEGKEYDGNGYLYVIRNKQLFVRNKRDVDFMRCDGFCGIHEKIFKEVKQKKKITLYRFIVENEGFRASVWDSDIDFLKKWANGALIVKTETKEIEVDE